MPSMGGVPFRHAVSAAAFAVGAGAAGPALGLPLAGLAATVAYGRLYTRVQQPADLRTGGPPTIGRNDAVIQLPIGVRLRGALASPGSVWLALPLRRRAETGHSSRGPLSVSQAEMTSPGAPGLPIWRRLAG